MKTNDVKIVPIVLLIFMVFGCAKESNVSDIEVKSKSNLSAKETLNTYPEKNNHGDIIWSNNPALEWADGYPIGNGRLGAMVLGGAKNERVALNHDLRA